MIRLIDPTQTHKFVPQAEKDKDDPVTFHVVPMNGRQQLAMMTAGVLQDQGSITIPSDVIYDLLVDNVREIHNVKWTADADVVILKTKADVRRFLNACGSPEAIAIMIEVVRYIQSISTPNEEESKN